MAKLKYLIADEKEFFEVSDIINSEVLITEDLTMESEVRKNKEGLYMIQVCCNGKTKDLLLASLNGLGNAVPKHDNWKLKKFMVVQENSIYKREVIWLN